MSAEGNERFYAIYRRSSCVVSTSGVVCSSRADSLRLRLGNALFEALDELIQSGHIQPQLAVKVLTQVSAALTPNARTRC